jgi:hypothetical protein
MTMWLKQSTAVTVKVGPFVDSTDGVTAETGLTISQADIRLSKNGGNIAQSNNAAGATHDELGYYDVPLDTTDTNTLGALKVLISESGALPVWQDFMVVPANVYDSLVGGSDNLQVDAVQIEGSDATDQINAAADTALADYDAPTKAELDSGLAALNDLDAAGIRTAVGLASANLDTQLGALPTAAENADAVLDEALSGHTTAGTLGKAVADIETDATAILADTNELQADWANGGRLDLLIDAILADTNELQGDWTNGGRLDLIIDAILADTAELQTDNVPGLIAALNNLSAAQVNAEMVDALATDTYAEPSGVPGATVTLSTKLGYLYMALRNQVTVTATKKTFFDDGGAAEWEKDLSDDGTTYTETEGNSI